jgi:glutathione S-transferase
MTNPPDKLHYLHIPNGMGGRAEMVRMTYVLAGKPWVDALTTFAEAQQTVTGKNPYRQFPWIETASGEIVVQAMAIMHHAAHGTPAWPGDPAELTRALEVALGAYDLYQAFGGFAADDLAARKKFEERRAPQYLGALAEIYARRPFAAGEVPCFADCMTHEAIGWVVRRNDVCRGIFESKPSLVSFVDRFRAIPAIKAFMERQAAAREKDNSV